MTIQAVGDFVPSTSLPVSTNGQILIPVAGTYGLSFDVNINSTDASGTLAILIQNTNDAGGAPYNPVPVASYIVTSGLLPLGDARLTVDSNFLVCTGIYIVRWTGTGTGTFNITGNAIIY